MRSSWHNLQILQSCRNLMFCYSNLNKNPTQFRNCLNKTRQAWRMAMLKNIQNLFLYLSSASQLAKTALSFSIVRHPFERLVSAYENKLVGPSVMGTWFRNNYGEPTFEKFARMIIQNSEGCQQNFCRSLNEHWRPYLEACSYCDIDYTFITKVSLIGLQTN